jgi:hypothetical protein
MTTTPTARRAIVEVLLLEEHIGHLQDALDDANERIAHLEAELSAWRAGDYTTTKED